MGATEILDKGTAILTGYVKYKPVKHCYSLAINSRILSKYLKSQNKKIRGTILRSGDLFFLNFDKKGNIVRPTEKHIEISISGTNLLNKNEILNLRSINTKTSFITKIAVNLKQFNLDKYYLYPDKDAARLAYELEKLGADIPNRIMTSHSFKNDLEFEHKNKDLIIEITRRPLSKIYQANFKHQAVGGNIRAHIFDIYRRCVTDKMLKKNKTIGYTILSEEWKNVKHIKDIIEECGLVRCHLLFADFENKNWAKKISREIMKITKNGTNLSRNTTRSGN